MFHERGERISDLSESVLAIVRINLQDWCFGFWVLRKSNGIAGCVNRMVRENETSRRFLEADGIRELIAERCELLDGPETEEPIIQIRSASGPVDHFEIVPQVFWEED